MVHRIWVEWGIKVEGLRFKVEGFDLCGILSPLIFSEGIFVFINANLPAIGGSFFSSRLFHIKTPSRLLCKNNYCVFKKLRLYKRCLMGKEAAMMNFSGDAPFNIISLFIFYYAIDGKIDQRSVALHFRF
jgi:hypothetical protein